MIVRKTAPTLALLCLSIGAALAATPDSLTDQEKREALVAADAWSFNGGTATLRFNTSLLELFGVSVGAPGDVLAFREHDAVSSEMAIREQGGIRFAARDGALTRFVDGSIHVDGRFHVNLPDGSRIDYDGFEVRVSPINPMHLDVIGNDGEVWFYVNHMMWEVVDDNTRFHLRAADLNATHALAARVGAPELAGAFVGELKFISPLRTRGPGQMGAPAAPEGAEVRGAPCVRGATPCFHGDEHPDGGIYEADVLMQNYSMTFMRCRSSAGTGSCDGNGPDDGEVVFAPSSTLRNTNNPNTADVPWHEKFFPWGNTNPWGYPYPDADQHPYLIWNLYRIVDGQLEQIAASGVKHAWLTTNGGCSAPFGGHILSPNCSDTYGTGNNDAPDDLGPRTEILPASGWFGRCGSIFDTNCDGASNSVSSNGYRDRLVVRESQLSVPGASYYSDSWYIVQDDINIYNTMMHKTIAPAAGSSAWTPGAQGANVLGPLINAWVDPAANPTRNVEIDDQEGHVRIAVKTKALASCPAGSGLSGTCYRYDYAVHNFDFARAKTEGTPPNLRVLSNLGFDSFTIPVGSAPVHIDPANHFADIDINAANNWTASSTGGSVTWTAPAGNELNWGTLYRFSLVTNVAPDPGRVAAVGLRVADSSSPDVLQATMMVPGVAGGAVQHLVTATAGAGGSISPSSQNVAAGGTAAFTVTPQAGFDVQSVVGDTCTPVDNGGGNWSAANIQAACQVLATFLGNNDLIFRNGFENLGGGSDR